VIPEPALEREAQQIDGVEAHQMRELDLVAHRVSARMPGIRELRRHVGRVHLGPVDPVLEPDPPPAGLDRDLRELALSLPDHLEELVVGRGVDAAAETVLADYASHGLWTSTDEAALGFPDGLVKASPD
jgi:hypothetical protein